MRSILFMMCLGLAACGVPQPDPVPFEATGPAASAASQLNENDVPALSEAEYRMRPITDLGLTGEQSVSDIGALLKSKFGIALSGEGHRKQSLRITEDEVSAVVIFEVEGFSDDSVKGEQHVVEILSHDGNITDVTGYGVRSKCYRGLVTDQWTIVPCS